MQPLLRACRPSVPHEEALLTSQVVARLLQVHGACGAWGLIAVGLFAAKEYSYAPAEGNPERLGDNGTDLGYDAGIFMEHSRGVLFGTQVAGCIIIVAWVTILTGVMFTILMKLNLFRVSRDVEDIGVNLAEHASVHWHPCPNANSPDRIPALIC